MSFDVQNEFKPASPEVLRGEVENLVPRRFAEFICFLAQHRQNYCKNPEYKPYDDLCKKYSGTRKIANYILASAHNNSKPSAGQVKKLFNIPESSTYKILAALREIGYVDKSWVPMKPLIELNQKRTMSFFDSPVFYMFVMCCVTYYVTRRCKQIEQYFQIGYWLNLFDEKPTTETPLSSWQALFTHNSSEESEKR